MGEVRSFSPKKGVRREAPVFHRVRRGEDTAAGRRKAKLDRTHGMILLASDLVGTSIARARAGRRRDGAWGLFFYETEKREPRPFAIFHKGRGAGVRRFTKTSGK